MNQQQPQSLAAALFNRRMLICIFTGFSSGLPLYILLNLLPAWLRSEGISLKAIGLFALIQFPYTWKFLWSPCSTVTPCRCSAGGAAGCC